MPKIKFLVDRNITDETGKTTQSYKAGKVYDLSDAIAYRWVRRQVAVPVEEPAEEPKATKKPKATEKTEEEDPKVFAKRQPPANKT